MMKKIKIRGVLGLTALLCLGMSTVSLAEVPQGMEQSVYDRLQDNQIDFDEVENLVQYYSLLGNSEKATLDGSVSGMQDLRAAYTDTIQDLRDTVSDLTEQEGTVSDSLQYSILEMQKNILNQNIRKLSNAGDDMDAMIRKTRTGINQSAGFYENRKKLSNAMESAIIGYKLLEQQERMYQKQVELYTSIYDMKNRMQATGMATALDVQAALYDLNGARLSQQETEEKLRSLQSSIGITLGWHKDTYQNIVFGELPGFDPDYMTGRDLAADIVTAQQNSSEYSAAQRMNDPAKREEGSFQRYSATENINVAMKDLYDTAVQAAGVYDAARTGLQVAAEEKAQAERKLALGLVGNAAWKGAEVQYIAAEAMANISAIQAYQAQRSYQWGLRGIMTLGE